LKRYRCLLLLFVTFFLFLGFSACFPFTVASTGQNNLLGEVYVKNVDHTLAVKESGLAVLNDTVALTVPPARSEVVPIENFSIGFPYLYRENLVFCFAYNTSNPSQTFNVVLDSGIGKTGFYGVTVLFPENTVLKGNPLSFTVTFVLENLVSPNKINSTHAVFNVSFPLYPSLPVKAESCNVTLIMPKYISRRMIPQVDFEVRDFVGSWQVYNHKKDGLQSFAYQPMVMEFTIHAQSRIARNWLSVAEVAEVERNIRIEEWKAISVSENYRIVNLGTEPFDEFEVRLPKNASEVMFFDELGNSLDYMLMDSKENVYSVSLKLSLTQNNSKKFSVTYKIPWELYISQEEPSLFTLKVKPFEVAYRVIKKLKVTLSLPPGAKLQNFSLEPQMLEKDALREKITFIYPNVTPFRRLEIDLTYFYPVFWASYFPTIWAGTAAGIICLVAFLKRAYKPPAVPAEIPKVAVKPEVFREFIEFYEEKMRVISELDLISRQMRRGKIPRRRYKVRRRTLESRLSALSKDLAVLKEQLKSTTPGYANIIRQLEVSEAEFEEAETGIRRVRARYRRGEISRDAYNSLLREYEKRRSEAIVAIQGVLLRLKEEAG